MEHRPIPPERGINPLTARLYAMKYVSQHPRLQIPDDKSRWSATVISIWFGKSGILRGWNVDVRERLNDEDGKGYQETFHYLFVVNEQNILNR